MSKLKIGGAWSGVLEVELEEWTVPMLREEVAKRSDCAPESINLICAGKLLKDGDGAQKLSQLGVKNNAKVLASRVCAGQGKVLEQECIAEEERCSRLNRLRTAVDSLAKRHADGLLPVEDFNIELENQSGETVQLGSETDRRAVMTGLILHSSGKQLIRKEKYGDALEVLIMGEEAFSLCNSKVIELIDNVSILQIDLVWCYFMLQDIKWLSEAGIRLSKARQGIERSHGKQSNRLRILQGGRHPEIALYLRMELLEGVVAYHSGQFEKSRKVLTSAQTKYFQLQVPDESLSLLMSMGYKEHDAKRALRMNNLDVQSAVDFLVEEKEKKAQKREEDIRRQREIMEQKRYGVTPLRKPVDIQRLNQLVSIGFEKELAAEALRRNENDTQKALDDLTNQDSNSAIQLDIESKKRRRVRQTAGAAVEEHTAMGFPRASEGRAVGHLLGQPHPNLTVVADGDGVGVESSSGVNQVPSYDSCVEGPSVQPIEERDVEMEDELTEELQKVDAFSDYDIEVTKEGEAIYEYLALLASGQNGGEVSSS